MAVLLHTLLWLGLALSMQATLARPQSGMACAVKNACEASGLVLLQAPRARAVRSRSRSSHAAANSEDKTSGDCADTNHAAGYNYVDDDGAEEFFTCEDYEPPFDTYCGEADDDFNSSAMCCACGGGGKKPAPYGLDLERRVKACKKKNVDQKCKVRVNHPSELLFHNSTSGKDVYSFDMTHLKSQCGLEVGDDGDEVLACIRTDNLPSCSGRADGSLCGKHFENALMSSSKYRVGKGTRDVFLLCSCDAESCPHCTWGRASSLTA